MLDKKTYDLFLKKNKLLNYLLLLRAHNLPDPDGLLEEGVDGGEINVMDVVFPSSLNLLFKQIFIEINIYNNI